MNPFGIEGHWKIDPDNRQDRSSSKVTTRKMTPEEIEKYSKCQVKGKTPTMMAVESMAREDTYMKKINENRLIQICKENGFTTKAYNIAAKEFGVSTHSVQCYVSKHRLSNPDNKLLAGKAKTEVGTHKKPAVNSVSSEKISTNSTMSVDEENIINTIKRMIQENDALKLERVKIRAALEDILKLFDRAIKENILD